nr:serine hydrolase [Erwinia rhapontici]
MGPDATADRRAEDYCATRPASYRFSAAAIAGLFAACTRPCRDQPKFVKRGEAVPDWNFNGYMVGAASLWSSGNDLLTYLSAHLYGSGDPTLDKAFIDATTIRFKEAQNDSSALAWLSNNLNGQSILYQSGFIGGYASYIGMDLKHKTAIVVLQNSFNWDNTIGHRMLLRMAENQDTPGGCR